MRQSLRLFPCQQAVPCPTLLCVHPGPPLRPRNSSALPATAGRPPSYPPKIGLLCLPPCDQLARLFRTRGVRLLRRCILRAYAVSLHEISQPRSKWMQQPPPARPPPLLRRRSRQSGSRQYRDKLCFLIFRPADFSRRTAAHYHPSTCSHGPGFPPRSVPGKRRPPPPPTL